MKYSIIIPSDNQMLASQAKNSLSGFNVNIFRGEKYESYSKLINDCVLSAEEEIVIIVNHKIRATPLHIYNMVDLIHRGYGLVCLQNFHFYGFKKDLFRKIGFFDERFIGGGYEDADLIRRLIEHNIGWYDAVGVPVVQMKTSWDNSLAGEFFHSKWEDGELNRLIPDEEIKYDLGEYKGSVFFDLKRTVLSKTNTDYFNKINFSFI
jgi:hypothetical protein